MRLFLYSLFAVGLGLLLWIEPGGTTNAKGREGAPAATGGALTMPRQCRPGKTSPEAHNWRWKAGTKVRVYYLEGHFSEAEKEALARAVNNWNDALSGTGSRVQFIIAGEAAGEAQEGTSITVLRGVPKSKERVGEVKLHSVKQGRVRLNVVISSKVTNLEALTSLMTHELGHTVGLADCYECSRGTTAMSAFKGHNKGNDVYQPSECDRYVVALAYATPVNAQTSIALMEPK